MTTTNENAAARNRTTKRKAPATRAEPLKKYLPTDRIKIEKQIEAVRAVAAVSGPSRMPVTLKSVSDIVKLTESTLALCMPFLVQAGFVEKIEANYLPCAEAVEFKRAAEFGADNAAFRLAPAMRRTWWYEVLRPKLEFQSLSENTASEDLGIAVAASEGDKPRLRALIELLVLGGVVQRADGVLTLVREDNRPPPPPPSPPPPPQGGRGRERERPPGESPTSGGISFNIQLDVSMDEIQTWDADRITAFMVGVTNILRAQKGDVGKP